MFGKFAAFCLADEAPKTLFFAWESAKTARVVLQRSRCERFAHSDDCVRTHGDDLIKAPIIGMLIAKSNKSAADGIAEVAGHILTAKIFSGFGSSVFDRVATLAERHD